jgi:hypothetical protein
VPLRRGAAIVIAALIPVAVPHAVAGMVIQLLLFKAIVAMKA